MPTSRTALLLLVTTLAGCRTAGPSTPPAPPAQTTEPAVTVTLSTVVFVRHGEKATDDPRDPSLSAAGEARALALAAVLGRAGVTHLFASEFRRTQATLTPLASATNLTIAVLPAAAPEQTIAAVRALPAGSLAVVAAHSNTLPAMIAALGGLVQGTVEANGQRMLPDDAYDRLFVVTRPAPPTTGEVRTLELRYGAATP
jgi:phosphohistidine phosphatase SixA